VEQAVDTPTPEVLLRAAIDQAGDAVIITDASGTIEYVNAAFERLTGYARSEALGQNPRLLKSGRQADEYYREMWATLSCQNEWRGRVFNRRKDGTIYAAECRTSPVVTTGRITTHFIQVQRDVTREVELEEILRNRDDALKRSEERFRGLLEDAPDAMILSSRHGTMLLINREGERCFAYHRDELIGEPLEKLIPTRYRERHREQCERFFAEGMGARSMPHKRLDLFALRKDGEEFPVEICLSPIVGREGVAVLSSVRDLTERRSLEQQLLQAQKMDAVGRLAAGIAHDFNNLLSVILAYASLALQDLTPDDPLRNDVGEIKKAGERAASLTRQLLAFGRKQVVQPKVINLNDVIAGMTVMLRRIIPENIDLVTRPTEDLMEVRADPVHMEQVIMNLVVNARDAMPHGGVLTIETANACLDVGRAKQRFGGAPGPHVVLTVSDTGGGMDEDTLDRLFEPFFTTKGPGKGTGLGLSTTHGIITQARGHISVSSLVGQGSAFKIFLPCSEPVSGEAKPQRGDHAIRRGSELVLVVEDDDQVRAVACSILARNGYRLIEARSATEALVACEEHAGSIDLLLTDVVMPNLSGPQLARDVVRRWPNVRVLYMSGYTDDAIVHHGVLDGEVILVEKPLTPQVLAAKVRQALDRR
jgi:PAS domain S-box-containing protein